VKPDEIVPVELTESRMSKKAKSKPHESPSEPTASKQDRVLALLRRQQGASIAEICEATGWQPQSVRGWMAGAAKKRLGLVLVSEKDEGGVRRYHVAAVAQSA